MKLMPHTDKSAWQINQENFTSLLKFKIHIEAFLLHTQRKKKCSNLFDKDVEIKFL